MSKAFHVIDRFSEDVDVTISCGAFNCGNPFEEGLSKTKIKSIGLEIRSRVTEHIDVIIPHFQNASSHFGVNAPKMELDSDGETLHLHYPSVLEQKNGYIIDSVRVEFGGRNLTTPNETHTITADISGHIESLEFPVAKVFVLSPEKTFWEKLTLMHYECNRSSAREDANRISRHWYDVSMLSAHDIGKKAIKNTSLLEEVIKVKKTFYDSGFARYDDCLRGGFRLVPHNESLKLLKEDFNKMIYNKMFYGSTPDFDQVIDLILSLEQKVNQLDKKLISA